MRIRPYRRDDADQIADILAAGWQVAYAGFMPPELLAPRVEPVRRRAEIGAWLDDVDAALEQVLVAETETPRTVIGFVHIVHEDKAGLGAAAHINLLYVTPTQFGRGIGRALMAAAADALAATTSGAIVLSAYALNPYRGFYRHLGGIEAAHRTVDFDGHALEAVYYRWDSPEALKAGALAPR